LVVDDNEAARKVLSVMIEALGWQCDAVGSGQEALMALQTSADRRQGYDVVFMD